MFLTHTSVRSRLSCSWLYQAFVLGLIAVCCLAAGIVVGLQLGAGTATDRVIMKLPPLYKQRAGSKRPGPGADDVAAARSAACGRLTTTRSHSNSCSFDFFSNHLLCFGELPSAGSWSGDSWLPTDCSISSSSTVPQVCPMRLRLQTSRQDLHTPRDVVIIGDSQGIRYTKALNRSLAAAGVTCVPVSDEGQPGFYGDLQKVETRRDCGGCGAFALQCDGVMTAEALGSTIRSPADGSQPTEPLPQPATGNSVTVSFQLVYLFMEFVLDFDIAEPLRIHWNRAGDAGSCNMSEAVPCRWAWSTQQFLFDAFFRRRARGYPAEIHIFQNIHDCARRNAADFRRDLRWLLDVIDTSAPASSNVYYWEAGAINAARQPADWARVTSNDCVRMMNAAVAEEVAPYIALSAAAGPPVAAASSAAAAAAGDSPSSSQPQATAQATTTAARRIDGPAWHGTYGLHEASLQRLDLNKDGVHFQDLWYDQVARLMLASYCPPAADSSA